MCIMYFVYLAMYRNMLHPKFVTIHQEYTIVVANDIHW